MAVQCCLPFALAMSSGREDSTVSVGIGGLKRKRRRCCSRIAMVDAGARRLGAVAERYTRLVHARP